MRKGEKQNSVLISGRRNDHFLFFVISTFYENKVFAVEDSENTKRNHNEGKNMPIIPLFREMHCGSIYPFPSCHFGKLVCVWICRYGSEQDLR